MIFNIFFSLSCFFILNSIIKAQDDFTISQKYHKINILDYRSLKSISLNHGYKYPGILLSILHLDAVEDVNMLSLRPIIQQGNNQITLQFNKVFDQIIYNCLVLDLSKFSNIFIQHDRVEISKADKKDEQSGLIEYVFFKDLDISLAKYKIKGVHAFLTGFDTGNNYDTSGGISIDLSATVEENRIRLSIKIRKSYIDINFVYYNYLVQYINENHISQYDIKTIYNQYLNSDKYPQILNGDMERLLKIDLDIQQEQILKDFKKFLFIGGNKIDFLIAKNGVSGPRFDVNFGDNPINPTNNKIQFTAKTWYYSKSNGFSIFSFQIYYKECSQTKQYFYQDKCYDKCPIGMYDKEFQCFQCPDNCKYCNETPGADLKCQECNDSFYNVDGVCQSEKKQEYYCNQKECNVKCGINCIDCQNGADQCNKCQDETLKWDEKSRSCICKLSNQFFNKVKKTCEKCETFCKTCENQANNCTSCGMNTKMDGGKCVCKSGSIFDDEGNCCTNKQKPVEKGQLKICECIDNTFYFDKAKDECLFCPIKNCKSCSMDGKCSQCNPGYNKFGNGVICRVCGKGIYADEKGDCSKNNQCMKGCFTCLDSLTCLKYDENHTFESDECHFSCKTCKGKSQYECSSCSSNTREQNAKTGSCSCKSGYVEKGQIDCEQIDKNQENLDSILKISNTMSKVVYFLYFPQLFMNIHPFSDLFIQQLQIFGNIYFLNQDNQQPMKYLTALNYLNFSFSKSSEDQIQILFLNYQTNINKDLLNLLLMIFIIWMLYIVIGIVVTIIQNKYQVNLGVFYSIFAWSLPIKIIRISSNYILSYVLLNIKTIYQHSITSLVFIGLLLIIYAAYLYMIIKNCKKPDHESFRYLRENLSRKNFLNVYFWPIVEIQKIVINIFLYNLSLQIFAILLIGMTILFILFIIKYRPHLRNVRDSFYIVINQTFNIPLIILTYLIQKNDLVRENQKIIIQIYQSILIIVLSIAQILYNLEYMIRLIIIRRQNSKNEVTLLSSLSPDTKYAGQMPIQLDLVNIKDILHSSTFHPFIKTKLTK